MRTIRSTLAIALFAALVIPGVAGVARASTSTSTPEIGIDWREMLDYFGCVVSIIGASNGPGVAAAATTCTRAIQDHWND